MSIVASDALVGQVRIRCLEIQAAEHCNLRCSGCAQNSPFLPSRFPDLSSLESDLRRLATVVHAERISVVGGEPLLNPNVAALLQVLRDSGIGDRMVVTTNGLLLGRAMDAFWQLVDAVEISLYPDTKDQVLRALPTITTRAWRFRTEIHLLPTPTFRRITLTEPIQDPATCATIFKRCYYKDFCHTLRDGKFYRCAPSTNIPFMVTKAGRDFAAPKDVGLSISQSSSGGTVTSACFV